MSAIDIDKLITVLIGAVLGITLGDACYIILKLLST